MAHYSAFVPAALLISALVTAGCEKSSDIEPQQLNARATSAIVLPGQLSPVNVGESWNQGPDVTGLTCYVPATLMSSRITSNMQVDTYEGKVVGCIPAERLVFNTTYTVQTQPQGDAVVRCHSVTETDGSFTLRVTYNVNSGR